ncbi:MAG: ADP-glyceromanno-heptose 6-epimerase [Candidatus Kapaibacterium sp.]
MIILTGGAGFIGSCMLAELNASGNNDVLIVDSLGTGQKWKNLVGKSYLDIVSKQEFRGFMDAGVFDDSVEAVIHLGACSSTTETNADYLYDNNYQYSIEVAEFAFEKGARLIYASSAATYGDGSRGYSDTSNDLRPLNMYGYSKHLFDQWIRQQGMENACVGLKFFNVFGPNEYHKGSMASLISKAVGQIESRGYVELFKSTDAAYGDGGQMRDFIYVKDVCRVMKQLLDDTVVNGILNLGTGTARSWNELIGAVFSAMERTADIRYIDMPIELSKQYQNFTQADMTTFASKLPDVRFGTLEESVADYVNGYLTREWPYL